MIDQSARRCSSSVTSAGWQFLLAAAFVLTWATIWGANLLLLVGTTMVGLFGAGWLVGRASVRQLQFQGSFLQEVFVGQAYPAAFELRNGRRALPAWGLNIAVQAVQQQGPEPGASIVLGAFASYLAAGQSWRGTSVGRFPARGKYVLETVAVSTRFPFGLIEHVRYFPCRRTVLVYPSFRSVSLQNHRLAEGIEQAGGCRPGRNSTEFYGVREWQAGDSRRWIHWRSSAKHGDLVVRQFELRRSQSVLLLLDLCTTPQHSGQPATQVELAVSTTAALVDQACRRRSARLALGIAAGNCTWIAGRVSRTVFEQAMTQLAVVRSSSADVLPQLLGEAVERIEPGQSVVLVSTRPFHWTKDDRFASLRSQPRWSELIGRLDVIEIQHAAPAPACPVAEVAIAEGQHGE